MAATEPISLFLFVQQEKNLWKSRQVLQFTVFWLFSAINPRKRFARSRIASKTSFLHNVYSLCQVRCYASLWDTLNTLNFEKKYKFFWKLHFSRKNSDQKLVEKTNFQPQTECSKRFIFHRLTSIEIRFVRFEANEKRQNNTCLQKKPAFSLIFARNLPVKNFRPSKISLLVNYDAANAAKHRKLDPPKARAENERLSFATQWAMVNVKTVS